MISVEIFKEKEYISKIQVEGHAGCGIEGEDLVCAAVSALVQTAIYGLQEFIPQRFGWSIDDEGAVFIVLAKDINAKEAETANIILKTLCLGLNEISKEYPDAIEIHKRRWSVDA